MSMRFASVYQCAVCGRYAETSRMSGFIFKHPELPDGWSGSTDERGWSACNRCSRGIDAVNRKKLSKA